MWFHFPTYSSFLLAAEFVFTNGQINKDFKVLEFAANGLDTNPTSIATLVNHEPEVPFPDAFTLCWRSKNSFSRGFWPGNFLEIPFKPGERFLAVRMEDNATTLIELRGKRE